MYSSPLDAKPSTGFGQTAPTTKLRLKELKVLTVKSIRLFNKSVSLNKDDKLKVSVYESHHGSEVSQEFKLEKSMRCKGVAYLEGDLGIAAILLDENSELAVGQTLS